MAQVLEQFDVRDSYSRHHPKTAPAKLSSALNFAIPKTLQFFGDAQAE
jgi:allophanate hydrolase